MGLGSALYLNQLLFGIDMGRILGMPLANVLGILLLSCSGLILIKDLGKPFRFLGVIRNIGSSWISVGAIADFVFIFVGGLLLLPDLSIGGQQPLAGLLWTPGGGPASILSWVVGAAALFIIVYPGLELSASRSIPFWHTILIPLQFLSSALASAVGLAYLVGSLAPSRLMAVVALIAALTALAFSLAHIRNARSQQGAARISADKLMTGSLKGYYLWGNLVLGLMLPALILVLDVARTLPGGLLALAGVLLLTGNLLAKYAVIRAGYYASLF
jgi:formate-dependent nitrite reductase membrane component NrfD